LLIIFLYVKLIDTSPRDTTTEGSRRGISESLGECNENL